MAYAIKKGSDYFDVDIWSGDSSATTQIATPFSPDFVWIKNRTNTGGSGAASHMLYDTVRGVQKELQTNLTDAEGTLSTGLNSFDSDGYKPGTSTRTNATGDTYVGWSWKGGDSTVVNTDGDITSNVSANPTSGFSVVTWTGTSVAGYVGHGLGVTPEVVICKARDTTTSYDDWYVYHSSLGNGNKVFLNSTAASSATSAWDSTSPNSTGFYLRNSVMNLSPYTYVAYVFAPVEGFSKFGTYTGNGSTDGPFIYTGFKPAFVMFKRTDTTSDWNIIDTARNTYNLSNLALRPNTSGAESTYSTANSPIDFISNGFKLRGTGGDSNASGGTYIYMAFAETPFKYATAR